MSRTGIRNGEIVSLVNMGILNVDYSSVDGAQAYKVYRFLRDLRKAAQDIEEQRGELVRRHVSEEELKKAQAYEAALKEKKEPEMSGEDYRAVAYEAALKEKKEPEMSGEDYRAVIAKLSEAGKEVAALMNDTTDIDVRPVPFEEYFKLKKANRELFRPSVDMALEGVLWKDVDMEVKEDGGGEGE